MLPTTSTGLLIGLGSRIVLEKVHTTHSPSHSVPSTFSTLVLGILLYQVLASTPRYVPPVWGAVAARLAWDLVYLKDGVGCVRSLLGVAIGILTAALCSMLWRADLDDYMGGLRASSRYVNRHGRNIRKRRHGTYTLPNRGLSAISEEGSDLSSLAQEHSKRVRKTETGLQIASLRSQAAAAAGDRRRYREERLWALEQGNFARANQLAWQIRKYESLIDSLEREARQRSMELKQSIQSLNVPRRSAASSMALGPDRDDMTVTQESERQGDPEETVKSSSESVAPLTIVRSRSAPPLAMESIPQPTGRLSDGHGSTGNDTSTPLRPIVPDPTLSSIIPGTESAFERRDVHPKDEYKKHLSRNRTISGPAISAPGLGYGLLNVVAAPQERTIREPRPAPITTRTSHVLATESTTTSPVLFVSTYTQQLVGR